MDKKTSAKRFDAAEFFNKILGSRFLLTIFSIVISFVVGAAFMLIIGMAFFQLGAEMAMTPLGEGVGSHRHQSAGRV